jgi:hypothetical protein
MQEIRSEADLRGWTALTAADRQSENVSGAMGSRAFGAVLRTPATGMKGE